MNAIQPKTSFSLHKLTSCLLFIPVCKNYDLKKTTLFYIESRNSGKIRGQAQSNGINIQEVTTL
jgi:hypothetical protein